MLILLVKCHKLAIFLITSTQRFFLEGELFLAEIQAAVGNNYGKLQSAINNFRNIFKRNAINKKYLLNLNDKLL